jgi:hypothetical protein
LLASLSREAAQRDDDADVDVKRGFMAWNNEEL